MRSPMAVLIRPRFNGQYHDPDEVSVISPGNNHRGRSVVQIPRFLGGALIETGRREDRKRNRKGARAQGMEGNEALLSLALLAPCWSAEMDAGGDSSDHRSPMFPISSIDTAPWLEERWLPTRERNPPGPQAGAQKQANGALAR